MKKTLIVLLTAVLAISMLFVSCSNEAKIDSSPVKISFGASQSRALSANVSFEDFDDLNWYYKATLVRGEFSQGATGDEFELLEEGLSTKITFSQGIWDFELKATKGTGENEAEIYVGSKTGVLIQRQPNITTFTVQIDVMPSTVTEGTIVIDSGINVGGKKVNKVKIGTDAAVPLNDSGNTTFSKPAGTYYVTITYENTVQSETVDTANIEYGSETIAITVYGGAVTTISGDIAEITQTVVIEPTDNVLKHGVTISGIAGVANFYSTIQDAYEAVKAMLVENSGLAEESLSEEAFNAFFTEGGKITWTIYGNHEVTDTRMFSFGRAANRFGEGRHITEINIVGGNCSASLDLRGVNGSFALPYNWWNADDSVNTALKCKNITFNGIKSMPSATYQCTLYPTTYEFDGCTFNGNLYSYQNFNVEMTIKNCTFNAPANTQYAFFAQGLGGTITLDKNVFNNYTRGINLQRDTADFIVTDNTIVSTVSEPDRGAIQLTDGKSFVVTGNKVDVNAGNAFWFHNAATNANVTYTINNNDIKAPYIGYSGVTAFDVNTKITSSGNIFNNTDRTKCMKKEATVAEATNLTAIR